jgi:hypothetical protein
MGPSFILWWERISPSEIGNDGFALAMRLSGLVSLTAGFLLPAHILAPPEPLLRLDAELTRDRDGHARNIDRVKQGLPLYAKPS